MATLSRIQRAQAKAAAQAAIARALQNKFEGLVRQPLPRHFTGLLAVAESNARVERVNARLQRLRRGLKGKE